MAQKIIPASVMKKLRHVALSGALSHAWNPPAEATLRAAVRRTGLSMRAISNWEAAGAPLRWAHMYVGLAFELGGEDRAQLALALLGELDQVEGAAVAARRPRRAPRAPGRKARV